MNGLPATALVRRSLWACERGAELIEFALVFPTLLAVMLAIIDFGFLFQRYEVVTNAAREGARIAVLPDYQGANLTNNVQARVSQYLTAAGLTGTSNVTVPAAQKITVSGGQCIWIQPVTVSYQHQFLFLGPIIGLIGGTLSDKTLNATSSMRSEIAAGPC
jgi:Flp pilus assembly protein TadG